MLLRHHVTLISVLAPPTIYEFRRTLFGKYYFEFNATYFVNRTWRCQHWKTKALLDKSIIVTNKTGWMRFC